MWSERTADENGKYLRAPLERFVPRLRIYPHALREDNAYYSPAKKALLFGYFHATTTDPRDELPGGMVFTCLSHDTIAHETTHAILDGMHRRLMEPRNDDMLAFHEGFADIIAIFQHFTMPGLLLDQITKTRGNLRKDSLLAQLASQFARSTGRGGALRNALGHVDPSGRQQAADPTLLGRTFEPHERGAILVAAVFEAFLLIYENRAEDLWRIASGFGISGNGDLHPDLAKRLANEAVEAAQRVLDACIRAIDYLPPVDVTFGDFLRALVTADYEFYASDAARHRLAFIQGFRNHGIYPNDVRTMSEDALRWNRMKDEELKRLEGFLPPREVLRTMVASYEVPAGLKQLLGENEVQNRRGEGELWKLFDKGQADEAIAEFLKAAWVRNAGLPTVNQTASASRFTKYQMERLFARFLHGWIMHQAWHHDSQATPDEIGWHFGLDIESILNDESRLEVHAVRPTLRLRPDGRSKVELLVMLTQRQYRTLPEKDPAGAAERKNMRFKFRGGSTIIIDPDAGCITYAISKNLRSDARFLRQAEYLSRKADELGGVGDEPFASLHANVGPTGGY
jgi:hypothetical protein